MSDYATSTLSSPPLKPPLFLNPATLTLSLWHRRDLIRELAWREIAGRYKGSRLGLLWALVVPLLMLTVYAFVFGVVFKARWGAPSQPESKLHFALTMFCGMCLFQIFSDCSIRASTLIVSNANYVKKVVFPLEILPVCVLAAALFHAALNFALLLLAATLLLGPPSPTLLCLPLVVLPLILLSLGFGWLLASLGVYLRDIGHLIAILMQLLFFATPVFYPIAAVPPAFQFWMHLNPLSQILEDARRIVIWHQWPHWLPLLAVTLLSLLTAQLGYAWFMRTKKGFADVV